MANNRELALGRWCVRFMHVIMQLKIVPYYALILMCFSYFKPIYYRTLGNLLINFSVPQFSTCKMRIIALYVED